MPTQKEGTELIVKGFSQFVRQIGLAATAVAKLGDRSGAAAQQMKDARDAMNSLNSGVTSLNRRAGTAATKTSNLAVSVTELNKGMSGFARNAGKLDKFFNTFVSGQQTVKSMVTAIAHLSGELHRFQGVKDATANNVKTFGGILGQFTAQWPVLGQAITIVTAIFTTVRSVVSPVLAVFAALGGVVSRTVVGAFNALKGALEGVLGAIKSVVRPFSSFIGDVLKIAAGVSLADVFRNIAGELRELAASALGAVSRFQELNIQFESLAARDIADQFGVPMAEAFKFAGVRAELLLDWIKQIAVTTPFTAETLASTLAMANAMGLPIERAKDLTLAVGNFTAAMGLTEAHMERIIYNFGQMQAMGKITGREIRDLTTSMVPMHRILAEMGLEVNKTRAEFQELALEGKVDVQDFFDKFIEVANRDFPGAMERMAKTFEGVKNNIKDFFEVILGVEVLGPVFDRITAKMSDFLQSLLRPEVRKAASTIGDTLRFALDRLSPVINKELIPAFINFARALGIVSPTARSLKDAIIDFTATLSVSAKRLANWLNTVGVQFATKVRQIIAAAPQWGANIVISFANGMARAVSAVIQVLNAIGQAIANLLAPGSPPKLLPKLPKWGAAAMNEYLKGFSDADFNLLEGVQDPLEDALNLLEETGKIGEGAAGKLLAQISTDLAAALAGKGDFGSVFDEIIASTKGLGPIGKEIVELAKRQRTLAASMGRLAQAEEELKIAEAGEEEARAREEEARQIEAAARDREREARREEQQAKEMLENAEKAEEAARVKTNDKIREYNRLVRQGANEDVLQVRLAEINASEAAAREATLARKAAEAGIDAAEDKVEQAQREVEHAQMLVEIEQKRVEVAERVVDTVRKRIDQIEAENDALEEQVQLQERVLQQLLELTRAQIVQPEQPDTDTGGGAGAIDEVTGALEDLGAAGIETESIIKRVMDEIEKFGDPLGPSVRNPLLSGDPDSPWGKFASSVEKVKQDFEKLESQITKPFENLGKELGTLKGTWDDVFGSLFAGADASKLPPDMREKGPITKLIDAFKSVNWKQLGQDIGTVASAIGNMALAVLRITGTTIAEDLRSISSSFSGMSNAAVLMNLVMVPIQAALVVIGAVAAGVSEHVRSVAEWFGRVKERIDSVSEATNVFEKTWRAIDLVVRSWLDLIATVISSFIRGVIQFFIDLKQELVGNSIVPEMMDAIKRVIEEGLNAIATFIDEKLRVIRDWFRERWDEIKTKVDTVADGLKTKVETVIGAIATFIDTKTAAIRDWFRDRWNEIKEKVDTAIGEIDTKIRTVIGELETWWSTTWDSFKQTIQGVWEDAGSVVDKIVNGVEEIASALNETLGTAINKFKTNFLQPLIDKFQNIVDKISGPGGILSWIAQLAGAIANLDLGKIGNVLGIGGGNRPQNADGGSISTSGSWVGEEGPEWFQPRVAGWIMNMAQLRRSVLESVSGRAAPQNVSAPALAPRGASASVVNINMGGVAISNGMELAVFEERVRRVVRTELS
jgi:tape measure domain-containing protein